jgi:acyl-CoA synthetase (AMP-forming)/AMP-acid ligase II
MPERSIFLELDRVISAMANRYKSAGLAVGQTAALHVTNQTQHLIASLALARLGAGQIAFDAADYSSRAQKELRQRLNVTAMVADDSARPVEGALALPAPPPEIAKLKALDVVVVGEEGAALPSGQVGRLRLKSAGMSEGYIGSPEETARDFKDGWFLSSDLTSFTEAGELVHHGHADDLMIFDGINIFPTEIENVLLHYPAVTEAAAFPIPSPVRGDIPAAA